MGGRVFLLPPACEHALLLRVQMPVARRPGGDSDRREKRALFLGELAPVLGVHEAVVVRVRVVKSP